METMKNNEKKFWNILNDLFIGAKVSGKSGFINLMRAKESYFQKVKKELLSDIENITQNNENFKDEIYNKLFSFFHRYFNDSGSIFYNYTPLFYNIYTKAYQNLEKEKTYSSDYEQIVSNRQDICLFYKTNMLYYVKSDKVFKDLEVQIGDFGGGGGSKSTFLASPTLKKNTPTKKRISYMN